jgi:murein L,D-transpeptidase YcbB/YkuD
VIARLRFRPDALILLVLLLLPAAAGAEPPASWDVGPSDVGREIHRIVLADSVARGFASSPEASHRWKEVVRFYEARHFLPVWGDDSKGRRRARELVEALGEAGSYGLNPDDYPVEAIEDWKPVPGPSGARDAATRELFLTYVFLTYARHLAEGRVNPAAVDKDWHIAPRRLDLVRVLMRAVTEDDVAGTLRRLNPYHPEYVRLEAALGFYRRNEAAGGWPPVAGRFRVELGDTSEKVAEVRRFLAATGDLSAAGVRTDSTAAVFDSTLDVAVRRFQARHGLLVDGIVGRRTVAQMEVPIADRVRTMVLNLERWRWLPDSLGTRYVMVNVPAFRLEAEDNGRPVLSMRVVAGSEYKPTPAFADRITYIDLNPRWYVPRSIATEEILPKLEEEPDYLTSRSITVLDHDNDAVNPDSVDWASVDTTDFPYRFRQEAGPRNPLGTIKFMFPNEYSVYLHDTSEPHLFDRAKRDLSHGCVRIEKPLDFAVYLLQGQGDWTKEKLKELIKSGKRRQLNLEHPMPVYLLYWTAFVDADGTVEFRRDLYGHDAKLNRLLSEYTPPYLEPDAFKLRVNPAGS